MIVASILQQYFCKKWKYTFLKAKVTNTFVHHLQFRIHLVEEERAGCFAIYVLAYVYH